MRACAITCSHGQPVEWRMRARLRWTMAARGEEASSVDRCARHACGEGNFRASTPCEVVSRWCQTELGVRTGACSEPHDNSQVSPSRTEGSRHGKATLAAAATSGVFAGRRCRRDGDRDAQRRRSGRKKVVRDWEEGEGGLDADDPVVAHVRSLHVLSRCRSPQRRTVWARFTTPQLPTGQEAGGDDERNGRVKPAQCGVSRSNNPAHVRVR